MDNGRPTYAVFEGASVQKIGDLLKDAELLNQDSLDGDVGLRFSEVGRWTARYSDVTFDGYLRMVGHVDDHTAREGSRVIIDGIHIPGLSIRECLKIAQELSEDVTGFNVEGVERDVCTYYGYWDV